VVITWPGLTVKDGSSIFFWENHGVPKVALLATFSQVRKLRN